MSSPTKAPIRCDFGTACPGHTRHDERPCGWDNATELEALAREFLNVTITWDVGQRANNQRLLVALLADTEAAAYARGLADGAERERTAAADYVHAQLGDDAQETADDIRNGAHASPATEVPLLPCCTEAPALATGAEASVWEALCWHLHGSGQRLECYGGDGSFKAQTEDIGERVTYTGYGNSWTQAGSALLVELGLPVPDAPAPAVVTPEPTGGGKAELLDESAQLLDQGYLGLWHIATCPKYRARLMEWKGRWDKSQKEPP